MNLMNYIFPGVFAFMVTVVLAIGALRFFPKWGLMDRPHKYGLKRAPIPYYGGLVVVLSFLISVGVFLPMSREVIGLIVGAVLIAGVSFWDDLKDVSPWIRLAVQFLAALVIVFSGIGIYSITNPLGGVISLDVYDLVLPVGGEVMVIPLLSAVFTVIWVMTITNTMNFLDGLNGLPSGVSAIAAFTLFLLSVRPGIHAIDQGVFATLSIIVAMIAFGFWFFDFYPAKILMGDTVIMFLGCVVAVLAIFSGGKVATAFLVLGIPLLDMVWVILRRVFWEKRSPMQGDLKHFHHRLLGVGMSDRQALGLIYLVSALFGGMAVFLESKSKLFALVALTVLMMILGFAVVRKGMKR